MHERGFGQDLGDPVGNDISHGIDVAKVVLNIVAKEEHGFKACQGMANWADGETFLEPSFPLSVFALEEEDVMQVG